MVKLKSFLSEKLDWNQDLSRMSSEINKVFKYAKIKVLKHIPFKRGYRTGDAALYGAFIHVKDKDGDKTVLPIEIDKKGIIRYAGGPSGWHKFEKIGALNMSHARPDDFLKIKTYARTADYLKQFAKLPGFGQDVIRRKESVHEGRLSSQIKKAIMIAIQMSGNMTGATNKIEKIKKGLSKDKKVVSALRLANESIDERSGDYGYANKELPTPRKISVPGIGVYTYDTLKKKVERMAKDLANNAKRGNWNKGGKNSIRAFAEMWNSLAEYERNAK